jgi:hypothetical protein
MTAAALRRLLVGAGHGTTGSVFLRRLIRSAALMMLLVFGAALAFLIKGSMPTFRALSRRGLVRARFNLHRDRRPKFKSLTTSRASSVCFLIRRPLERNLQPVLSH